MGDPKKHRKKYTTPLHPWRKERLDVEGEISREYGLKNKKEIYKMDSFLRSIKSQLKRLTSSQGPQIEKEMAQLVDKLKRIGLFNQNGTIDDVLGLDLKNVMDRRLQTVVFKKGLANSVKQARQFIVHEHILVGDKKITSPGYIVPVADESRVSFSPSSNLSNEDHPERQALKGDLKKEVEKIKLKKEKPVDEDLDVPDIEAAPAEELVIPEDADEIQEAISDEENKDE